MTGLAGNSCRSDLALLSGEHHADEGESPRHSSGGRGKGSVKKKKKKKETETGTHSQSIYRGEANQRGEVNAADVQQWAGCTPPAELRPPDGRHCSVRPFSQEAF